MGLLGRLLRRRPPAPVVLDPADPTLIVLVEAFEAARADSSVLAEALARGVDLDQPLLVRHYLLGLPDAAAVARAAELLGQDGYALHRDDRAPDDRAPDDRAPDDRPGTPDDWAHDGPGTPSVLLASRTQVLTAMSASQERSRMAGLAQRLGGDVGGWDALGPPGAQRPADPRRTAAPP